MYDPYRRLNDRGGNFVTEFLRRLRLLFSTATPTLPRPGVDPPGTRLATLRAVAAQTGWGAGIGATAALVSAVCREEDTRIATIGAPLVAVAAALAGYATVAYGEEPPIRPVPTVPLVWGSGSVSSPRRFDAVAVDATAQPLAPEWLDEVFGSLAFRGGRVYLAILCTATDAPRYSRECHIANWDMQGVRTNEQAPPVTLLTSARFRLLGS